MSDREFILDALQTALQASEPPVRALVNPSEMSNEELWALFTERIELLGGAAMQLEDLVVHRGKLAWIDDAVKCHTDPLGLTSNCDLWSAEIGFTSAELAIAESGSVVVSVGDGITRSSTLTPMVAVLFVNYESIVETLEDAINRIPKETSAIITGPSRTADIEGTLVRGVHSPGEIWVVPTVSGDVV